MISKPLVLGLLAATCAAAGGAYVAVRQNQSAQTAQRAISDSSLPKKAEPVVAETEAVISPSAGAPVASPTSTEALAVERERTDRAASTVKKEAPRAQRSSTASGNSPRAKTAAVNAPKEPALAVERPSPSREAVSAPVTTPVAALPQPEPIVPEAPPVPARPAFVEVVVPASSVVGLNVERSITSETARVEDRVEARVTRDVMADGRVAIPAGTRVIGDVTLVERGGKMKDKARLGVRFHTLVLANGNQVPFRTDAIFREGSSPGAESARKIGGAAIGGAILGAIIGGAKGAAIGGATGAAGGSAVVMAGDRNAATLPAGTIVTVRLSSPVNIDVEREQ